MSDIWTFHLRGGGPVSFQPPGNPVATHNGGTSVFHLMLTHEQVQDIQNNLEAGGVRVRAWPSPKQTEEQRAERRELLGVDREDAVYPSTDCMTCFWFDPLCEGFCGYQGWPPEAVQQALVSHEAAVEGYEKCPVREQGGMVDRRTFNNDDEVWVVTYGCPDTPRWTKAKVFVGMLNDDGSWSYQLDIEGYPDDVNCENGGWWRPSDMETGEKPDRPPGDD